MLFYKNLKINLVKNSRGDNGKSLNHWLNLLKLEMRINVEVTTIKCKKISKLFNRLQNILNLKDLDLKRNVKSMLSNLIKYSLKFFHKAQFNFLKNRKIKTSFREKSKFIMNKMFINIKILRRMTLGCSKQMTFIKMQKMHIETSTNFLSPAYHLIMVKNFLSL